MMLDQFKLALAIVDVGGIVAFFVTFANGSANPAILIYLLVFNILAMLTDTLRKGLVVHKPDGPVPDLSDHIPINPVTGNRLVQSSSVNIFGNLEQEQKQKQEPVVRQFSESTITQRPVRIPPSFTPSQPKDKDREEMEQVLQEWIS